MKFENSEILHPINDSQFYNWYPLKYISSIEYTCTYHHKCICISYDLEHLRTYADYTDNVN